MSNGDAVFLTVAVIVVLSVLGLLIWIVNEVLKGCLRILKRLEPAWRAAAKRVQERLAEGVREPPFALSRSSPPLMPSGAETSYCPVPPVEPRKMKPKFLVLSASALLVCASAYATYPGAKDEWKDFRPVQPGNWVDWVPPASVKTVEGFARVVDGDTVVVNGTRVRLKGVDAPELSHPSGIEAKLALQGIIGPSLTCQLTGERTHDREVGWCYNIFGSDIGAAIILAGKALACPHYDRRYVALEQPDAIARLPRASYCRARG
jgi:hypothetical protein